MNILPLVSAFIILFAIGSYTFLHSVRAAVQEKFHYTGALAVERTFASQIQNEIYKDQKGKGDDSDEKTDSKKNENKKFESPRDDRSKYNNRKINIKKLSAAQGNPQLEKVVLTLLRDIYGQTAIYTPNLEHEVLATLIATLKLHPSVNSFEELLPKISSGSTALFYKLIKGTQDYELRTKKGYPALGDFLSLEGKPTKPINFYTAYRPVLSAVFGEKICELILIEEQRKWEIDHKTKHLTKAELDAFLKKIQQNLSDYEPLLQFSNSADKTSQEIVKDTSSKMQIRINN